MDQASRASYTRHFCVLACAVALLVACGGQKVVERVDGEASLDTSEADTNTALPAEDVEGLVEDDVGEDVSDSGGDAEELAVDSVSVMVTVTIDGAPAAGTLVVQGGNPERWTTDGEGFALIEVDLRVPGDHFVMASHPEARIAGERVHYNDPFYEDVTEITINLERFDRADNEEYVFKAPGEPGHSHVIEECSHCHLSVAASWGESVHRVMAKNPVTHDVYEGTATGIASEQACFERGGVWLEDIHPSTGEARFRCKVTQGVLDEGTTGGCADCHAPGIDGVVGGRDLRDAQGRSYDEGAHCDVCHHVESVDLSAPAGVAGALNILRPSETAPFGGVGKWHPLTFCPNPDNANKLMSCVQRDHFRESAFCGACHELAQPSLIEEVELDPLRWPNGVLPIQTTFSEWAESIYAQGLTCQGCHMPAAPDEVINGADLQAFSGNNTGITGGWPRPPGSVHLHSWPGPRSSEEHKLPPSLVLKIEHALSEGVLSAAVTVTNAGAGHAVPTGEPLRALLVLVSATCEGEPLVAIGGDALSDVGGAYAQKGREGDWNVWAGAEPGQRVRVVKRTGAFHDYTGFGPFGDGTFDASQKGLPVEHVVGEAIIKSIDGDVVVFETPLPEGDIAYLVDSEGAYAGASGFAYARVTLGRDARRLVHHYEAIDIVSDNRLLAGASWTSEHHFAAPCSEPVVSAQALHRGLPLHLAKERGWALRDQVVTSAQSSD